MQHTKNICEKVRPCKVDVAVVAVLVVHVIEKCIKHILVFSLGSFLLIARPEIELNENVLLFCFYLYYVQEKYVFLRWSENKILNFLTMIFIMVTGSFLLKYEVLSTVDVIYEIKKCTGSLPSKL